MLGDRAQPRHERVRGEPGSRPEQIQLEPTDSREQGQQDRIRDEHAPGCPARNRILAVAADGPPPGGFRELPARLPGEVAPGLAPEARLRDREGHHQFDVRILIASGPRMVLQVVGAVWVQIAPDRVGAEPVAHPVVPVAAAQQGPMRRLVHEHREAELAGSDHEQCGHDRQRVGPVRNQRHRRDDETPVERDRAPGSEISHLEQIVDLVARERRPPTHLGLRRGCSFRHWRCSFGVAP